MSTYREQVDPGFPTLNFSFYMAFIMNAPWWTQLDFQPTFQLVLNHLGIGVGVLFLFLQHWKAKAIALLYTIAQNPGHLRSYGLFYYYLFI